MMDNIFKKVLVYSFALTLFVQGALVTHAAFDKDLYIQPEDINFEQNVLAGQNIRIYAKVHNSSSSDLGGVVKFYDERLATFIGGDLPISVIAGATDDVFVDYNAREYGEHIIAVRVIPWDNSGDDPGNNKIHKSLFVDKDSDGDGIGDNADPDDDNDGVSDFDDAFPNDPSEWLDSDGDGIGDNADPDDDNDGISDAEDLFPLDPNESVDSDQDGVGDNSDPFPSDPNEWSDADSDGLGDNADPDSSNKGPIPVIETARKKVRVNQIVTFNALRSRDPDGDISAYEWNFGDGIVETGVVMDHVFTKRGSAMVSLKVTDDRNESRVQKIQIIVGYSLITFSIISLLILSVLVWAFLSLFHPHIKGIKPANKKKVAKKEKGTKK